MESYDVAVIGAGLAGLQCARLMGERGLRVLLVDRKNSLAESVHTTGIFVRRTLEDFDLPEDCLGAPVRHVKLYSPSRRRPMMLESRHDEFRVGRMDKLYERYLERATRAGVAWSPRTRYQGLKIESERVTLNLVTDENERDVQVRYIVGADGARSRVARDLGLEENSSWIVGCEEVYEGIRLDGPPCFHCFLDPQLAPGYLAWIVQDEGETHIGVGGYAARFDAAKALTVFRQTIAAGIIDLTDARQVARRGGRIPVGGVLRRIVNEHGLLTGDAAGAVSPLTAGGLDPCLRLSSLAASVVEGFLNTGDHAALAPYAGDQFRARFVSRLWMRRVIDNVSNPFALEMICAALRLPLLRLVAAHVFFGRGSFPDVQSRPSASKIKIIAQPN